MHVLKWRTDLKERSKLHAGIQGFSPTAGSNFFISAFLFDLPAQHPASAMGWHISSGTRTVVAVLTLHPAHVHRHTSPPHTHPPSQRINRAQMLHPHSFGSKPAKSLMLRGGRHACQGFRIPRAQGRESCFHPSLAHICFLRGWGQPGREQSCLSLTSHPKCLLIFSLSLQKTLAEHHQTGKEV